MRRRDKEIFPYHVIETSLVSIVRAEAREKRARLNLGRVCAWGEADHLRLWSCGESSRAIIGDSLKRGPETSHHVAVSRWTKGSRWYWWWCCYSNNLLQPPRHAIASGRRPTGPKQTEKLQNHCQPSFSFASPDLPRLTGNQPPYLHTLPARSVAKTNLDEFSEFRMLHARDFESS